MGYDKALNPDPLNASGVSSEAGLGLQVGHSNGRDSGSPRPCIISIQVSPSHRSLDCGTPKGGS